MPDDPMCKCGRPESKHGRHGCPFLPAALHFTDRDGPLFVGRDTERKFGEAILADTEAPGEPAVPPCPEACMCEEKCLPAALESIDSGAAEVIDLMGALSDALKQRSA